MKFSVVLPVRDDPGGLQLALSGLAEQTRRPDEIIIVNASEKPVVFDETAALPFRVAEAGTALPGRARNAGAREAMHHWVVFLDAGTRPVPGWLDAFRLAVEQRPEADVVYGCFVPNVRDDWDYAAAAVYLPPREDPDAGSSPTTASFCVRRSFWQSSGGMSENLRAGEDLLFFRDVEARRAVVVTAPGARVVWDLPAGPRGHYRRLRRYSCATWPTPLASQWQWPLLRMYAAALAVISMGFAVYPVLLLLLPAPASARMLRNYRRRRGGLAGRLTWQKALRIAAMTGLADAATLLGISDSLRRRTSE